MELTADQHQAAREYTDVHARLRKNRSEAKQAALMEELTAVVSQHKEATGVLASLKAQLASTQKDVRAVAARVADQEAHIQAETARLNAGTGLTSKDLVALDAEIEHAKTRLHATEEEELELLRAEEDCTSQIAATEEKLRAIAARGTQLQEQRATQATTLDAQARELNAQLATLLSRMGEFGTRVKQMASDGAGVAILRTGACGACGNALSGTALHALTNAGTLAVAQCEECEAYIIQG